jgi:outer membrane protein assembly factor BamB
MIRRLIIKLAIPVLIAISIGLLSWWLIHDPVASFSKSVPGMDNRDSGKTISNESVRIGEAFSHFKELPDIPGTRWNRFRGPDYDNINKENIPLLDRFGKEGPKILWKKQLGDGHAAPAILNGKVYLLDYDEKTHSDALKCLLLSTGEELWDRSYKVHLKRNHGLSRTIPAVTEKYVVTIGPRGHVMCVNRMNGDLLWGIDLEKEYNAEIPFWYTGQCPVIENDTAIIAIGGKSMMIGIDCKTGKVAWTTPNPMNWKMSHSSIMPMIVSGKKMWVYAAIGGICGISASGADMGTILWKNSEFAPAVVAPTPLILDNGMIVFTAGYGAGTAIIRVTSTDGKFAAKMVDQFRPSEGVSSEQQTPLFFNGYLYSIMPKDAGELRNRMAAFDPADCRKVVFSSDKSERFGLGPYIVGDGKFFILSDDGEMTIAKASGKKFNILDKARIINGQDSWGPIAISGGYLLMRDSHQLVCIDVHKNR